MTVRMHPRGLTASAVITAGDCTGLCLTATPASADTCDCRCAGTMHGALARVPIPDTGRTPNERAGTCGAAAPTCPATGQAPGVRCELPADHTDHDADRLPLAVLHHHGAYGSWQDPP